MKKLIAILKSKQGINEKYYFVFSAFLTLSLFLAKDADVKSIWIVFSCMFALLLIKKPEYLLLSLVLLVGGLLIQWWREPKDLTKTISGNYEVINTISTGPIIRVDGQKVVVRTFEKVFIHDIIHVEGDITTPKNNSNFDFVTYLRTMNIGNIIMKSKVDVLETSHDVRTVAIKFLSSGGKSYKKIAPLMVLGKKTHESREIYKMAFKMSIIHLFVISGFHISLFFLIISKGLSLVKVNEKISSLVSLIPIIAYLYLLNFPLSATRAAVLIFFGVINKVILNKKFSTINILAFTMLLMFVVNPNSIYSLSFIFTFIATFVVIYINSLEFKTNTRKYFAIAIGAYLSNAVIATYTNGWISIFGVFFGALLSPVFVITYSLSLFLFPFKGLMEYIYIAFIFILNSVDTLNIVVDFNRPSLIFVQFIYLIPFSYLIIKRIWNLYTDKNNTLLIKN